MEKLVLGLLGVPDLVAETTGDRFVHAIESIALSTNLGVVQRLVFMVYLEKYVVQKTD